MRGLLVSLLLLFSGTVVRTVSTGTSEGRVLAQDSVIRLWGGHGVISFGGNDYLPLGDRAFAQQTAGAIGGIAQGYTLGISGVEADALALLDPAEVKGASVVLYRLIFASDGQTLLDAHVFDRGRGDTLESVETVGGPAVVNYAVESSARGLGRSLSRQRADYDQRLIDSNDGYFRNVAYAGEKMLYWGGKKPSRSGAAVAGSGTGSTGGSSIGQSLVVSQ
jgi:hypothetical protein